MSEIDLIKEVGECECPRCCCCQLTTVRCENCKQKHKMFYPCSHFQYDHTPCIFNEFIKNVALQDVIIPNSFRKMEAPN